MKKTIAVVLAFCLLLGLAACGTEKKGEDFSPIFEQNHAQQVLSAFESKLVEQTTEYSDGSKSTLQAMLTRDAEGEIVLAVVQTGPVNASGVVTKGVCYAESARYEADVMCVFPEESSEDNLCSLIHTVPGKNTKITKSEEDNYLVLAYSLTREDGGKDAVKEYYNAESKYLEKAATQSYDAAGALVSTTETVVTYNSDVTLTCPAYDRILEEGAEKHNITIVDVSADGTETTRTFPVLRGGYMALLDNTGKFVGYLDREGEYSLSGAMEQFTDATFYFIEKK